MYIILIYDFIGQIYYDHACDHMVRRKQGIGPLEKCRDHYPSGYEALADKMTANATLQT